MNSLLENWKKGGLLLLLILLFFLFGIWSQNKLESDWQSHQSQSGNIGLSEQQENDKVVGEADEIKEEVAGQEVDWVYIDVKGAVHLPDVYRVPSNSRVLDVIERAGGFTKEADQLQINLALKVSDQMLIYVPKKGENPVNVMSPPLSVDPSQNLVNINTATLSQLMDLNGIGEKKAEAIIKYREENGTFTSIEDLLNVPGIGEGILSNIREEITI